MIAMPRLGAAVLLTMVSVAPALAQTGQLGPPDRDRDVTGAFADAPGGMMYPRDGNTKMPRQPENPNTPFYQRGSAQQTGGPARELLPLHFR